MRREVVEGVRGGRREREGGMRRRWGQCEKGNLGWGRGGEGERGEMTTHIRGNEQHLEKPLKNYVKYGH